MITIIFAPPRTGKTCYMTYVLTQIMFDRQRARAMQHEIINKRVGGFTGLQTIPQHCVSANYEIIGRKFGYSPRVNRKINPYRLGYANDYVETHFSLPFEAIGITEAQKYLNSRMSMYFPDWQSRYYEQHGHNDIDIWLDTQRPPLIDVNVRALSRFEEIVELDIRRDRNGRICGQSWLIHEIENNELFERYMASGKKDKSCYTQKIVTSDFNVFDCYNSQSCKPKFYDGHFYEDFDYQRAMPPLESMDGYIQYLQENDDELPQDFYVKRCA